MRDLIAGRVEGAPVSVEEVEVAGVPVYVITPDGTAEDDRRVFDEDFIHALDDFQTLRRVLHGSHLLEELIELRIAIAAGIFASGRKVLAVEKEEEVLRIGAVRIREDPRGPGEVEERRLDALLPNFRRVRLPERRLVDNDRMILTATPGACKSMLTRAMV